MFVRALRSCSVHFLKRHTSQPSRSSSSPLQIYCASYLSSVVSARRFNSGTDTMSHEDLYAPADRIAGQGKNVWVEFSALARKHNAVNLGQGFPDFPAPKFAVDALVEATSGENFMLNQYTRSQGHPRLVKAVAELHTKLQGREIDPETEVITTCGAYHALFCCFQALVNPGDEVILIEPFFDCYLPMAQNVGAKAVCVPMRPTEGATTSKDWILHRDELEASFSEKTKFIIINTPHNPLGKILSREELEMIAELCIKYNTLCISDEVYEWLVYGDEEHVRMATLPGMWERTVTIGSAGKTFSVTGWKLGWAVAPKKLIRNFQTLQANTTYTLPTPIQEAVAVCLEREIPLIGTKDSFFNHLANMVEKKRDLLASLLEDVGIVPVVPQGGYFLLADVSKIDVNLDDDQTTDSYDYKFVRWLTINKKLATIPPSAFYGDEGHKHLAAKYIRFCFMKEDSTLEKTAEILRKWQEELKSKKV